MDKDNSDKHQQYIIKKFDQQAVLIISYWHGFLCSQNEFESSLKINLVEVYLLPWYQLGCHQKSSIIPTRDVIEEHDTSREGNKQDIIVNEEYSKLTKSRYKNRDIYYCMVFRYLTKGWNWDIETIELIKSGKETIQQLITPQRMIIWTKRKLKLMIYRVCGKNQQYQY